MLRCLAGIIVCGWLGAGFAGAQEGLPAALKDVGIDQRLNEQVPLDLVFKNESGKQVELRRYFGRKPVVLSLVYYECPMLCTMVLNGMLRSLRALKLDAGKDFEILTVSFDPKETPDLAAAKKQSYLERYQRPGAKEGWHFLTGDERNIRRLTEAAGFRYRYDAARDQYVHASGIMVLTPDGRLARYLYGIEYSARDLRLALVEASAGRIGNPVDKILLYCFHYDPSTGKYSLLIMNVIRAAGSATVLVLATFLIVMFRRDRRKRLNKNVDGFSAVS
jgi:protein SCO1/2